MFQNLMWLTTYLALPASLGPPAWLCFRAREPHELRRWAGAWLSAALLAGLFALLLQFIFLRERPVEVVIGSIRLAGYPSGHAAIVSAAAVVVWLRRPRWWWWLLGFVALVGWSRVALGYV